MSADGRLIPNDLTANGRGNSNTRSEASSLVIWLTWCFQAGTADDGMDLNIQKLCYSHGRAIA